MERQGQLQGLLASVKTISPVTAIGILLGSWVVYQTISFLRDPLRSVPGPFLARFTRLWYLNEVARGHFEKTNIELHKKHGMLEGPQSSTSSSCVETNDVFWPD